MTMTLNEAIEMLNNIQVDTRDLKHALKCSDLIETAVKAMEEVQEYRKLGTLEELARAKKYIDLAKKHGTIGEMIDECAEYESVGTVEECREAVEKQKAEKIEYETNAVFNNGFGHYRIGKCPICDSRYNSNDEINYCSKCGKKLDWSEENE